MCIDQHEIRAMCSDVWTAAMHAFGAQIIPNHINNESEGNAFMEKLGKNCIIPDSNYIACC